MIVDDNVTQGGTLADPRSYSECNAGYVIGASTLTGSRQSEKLAPRSATLTALRARFPEVERQWKETLGYDFDGLTEGEATYLLRSDPADGLGDRVLACAQAGAASPLRRD